MNLYAKIFNTILANQIQQCVKIKVHGDKGIHGTSSNFCKGKKKRKYRKIESRC